MKELTQGPFDVVAAIRRLAAAWMSLSERVDALERQAELPAAPEQPLAERRGKVTARPVREAGG
jgi:hypothetical protein